jgi:hypothetical protein
MWILDALDEIPLKKPLLICAGILAAAFLLLAQIPGQIPLIHPVTFTLVSLTLYLLNQKKSSLRRALLLIPAAGILSYFLVPQYLLLFTALLCLLAGLLIFSNPSGFLWRWVASSALLYSSVLLTAAWQSFVFVERWIPSAVSPAAYGAIFGFCVGASFLPWSLRKNEVEEAYEESNWKLDHEADLLSSQARDLYNELDRLLKQQKRESKIRKEVEEFTARILRLTKQLQEMKLEMTRMDIHHIEKEIEILKVKIQSTNDVVAQQQYERAMANRVKQKEQCYSLLQKIERVRAQITHCITGLENMRFAYANHEFSSGESVESIDFYMNMAANHADNTYETSEAYQRLIYP